MKNIKYILLATVLFISHLGVMAQTIEEGRRLTRNEQYEDAEKVYNNLIAANAKKGDPYYWAGINFLERGDSIAAGEIFDRGLLNSPKFTLNYVGKAQLLLRQGKIAEADAMFLLALKTKKKLKPIVNREIGRTYLMIKDRSKAVIKENAKTALKYFENAGTTDFEVKLLQGDAEFIANPTDASLAITRYIESGYINEADPRPLLREAMLYQRVENYELSMVRIDEALAKDAGFAPGYRQKADLYSEMKIRDSAVVFFKKYLELNNNLSARRKYVTALYYNQDFDAAIKEAKDLLKLKEFTNLYGVIAYAIVEKKDTSAASLKEGLDYFELYEQKHVNPASRGLSASETFYKGILLYRSKQKDAGYSLLKSALKDTMRASVRWYDMTREMVYTGRDYKKALEVLALKEAKTKTVTPLDMYYTAMSYHKDEQYEASNKVFTEIVTKDSTYLKGFYYLALNWHLLDPTDSTGNVSKAYLKWISRMNADEKDKNKRDIERAYRTMADFEDNKASKAYGTPEDKASGNAISIGFYKKAIELYKVVLTFDPEDESIVGRVAQLETFITNLEKRKTKKR